jgi:hypothetical protein
MEGVTIDLIGFLIRDRKISPLEATDLVYSSALFEKLCDEETGIYRESSAYNYSILKDELEAGVLVQNEI